MAARPPVPPVVSAFAAELRSLLGDRLVGVYLGGSFSLGDFVDGTSDYDLLVVVADPLSADDLARLASLHEALLERYGDARRLEGDYAPVDWLIPEGTRDAIPWFRDGRLRPRPERMLSADNIANLRASAIAVAGPPPDTVLPPVSPDQIRASVREMLTDLDVCATEAAAADEILSLLRSMRALETGAPTTKSDGLRWGLSTLDPAWHPLVERAAAVRRGAPVFPEDDTLRRGLDGLRTFLFGSGAAGGSPG